MKNILILFIGLIFFSSSSPIKPDKRVIDYLGNEKIDIIKKNNPDLIHYYNFFLDNSYILSTVPTDKLEDNNFQTLKLPLKNGKVDTKKLNVLKLNIKRSYEESIYFKVEGSQQVFIMLSEKKFVEKFNEYRKSNGLMK